MANLNMTSSINPQFQKAKLDEITKLLRELERDLETSFLNNPTRKQYLEKLKVHSRDPVDASPIYTLNSITILAKQAFLPETSKEASTEALSCIANAILLRVQCREYLAEQDCWASLINTLQSPESHDQFLAARIMFVLTYVESGALYKAVIDAQPLAETINQKLAHHATRYADNQGATTSTMVDDTAVTEITKLLFNITNFLPTCSSKFSGSIPHLLVIATSNKRRSPLQQPISPALNALLHLDTSSTEWNTHAYDTTSPTTILAKLIAILDASIDYYKDRELNTLVSPVVALFSKLYASAPALAKTYLQQQLLPSEQDRAQVLGHSSSLASRLLKLSNAPSAEILAGAISQLLYELSDSDPDSFVRNVGLGYASGYLVSNGLPLPTQGDQAGDDGAAGVETTAINPVTGQRRSEERSMDDLPPMTEEEKEREAERLFVLFERLKATGVMDVRNPVENAHRFEELPD